MGNFIKVWSPHNRAYSDPRAGQVVPGLNRVEIGAGQSLLDRGLAEVYIEPKKEIKKEIKKSDDTTYKRKRIPNSGGYK